MNDANVYLWRKLEVKNQLQTFVNVSQKTETFTKQIIFISFWTANEMA